MSRLLVARRIQRRGLLVPMLGTKASPSLLFPLDGVSQSEIDELIRATLQKLGITEESQVQAIIEKAEQDSEVRIKVEEAKAELRRLMALKASGAKLIQMGYRRWQQVFFPATKRFEKDAT